MMEDQMKYKVVICHSNDLHSRLENAAKISSILSQQRAHYGEECVLVLDIGDHMDRMRMETEGSLGKVHIDLLEQARYEAITLGNNEGLTFTQESLASLYQDVSFEILCANLTNEDGSFPKWLKPSTIIKKNNITFGLIGLTADFLDFYQLMGWETSDPVQALQSELNKLRLQVDVIVVLSHLGLPRDEQLAREIEGIDLILGAHTHHLLLEPLKIGNTMICAAGKFGEYVGKVEIELEPITRKLQIEGTCIPTAAYDEDKSVLMLIDKHAKLSKQTLNNIITTLKEPLPASINRESPLVNLLALGLRRWCEADIGLVNAGQLLGGLAIGEVTAGELHALCPSPINPCRMELSGDHILKALEQSLLHEYVHMPIKGFGFRGEQLGMLGVDGLEIEVDLNKPPMKRITYISINQQPFNKDAIYTVGTIDMFTFGVGYKSLAQFQNPKFYLPEFLRDLLAYELQLKKDVEEAFKKRWIYKI